MCLKGESNESQNFLKTIIFLIRFLTTCSFDFLTDDDDTRVFVACIFTWAYFLPLILITFFYAMLFKHVRAHEAAMKKQAEKMNVKSLASNKDTTAESVEIRIAKAAFTIFFMFVRYSQESLS